jgi:long-chain acyl-CoA synthetase
MTISMLVHHFLEVSAERLPDKVALICNHQRLSYQDIETQSNRLANAFRSQGLQRGDRIALYLQNCVEIAISIFAVLKAGCVFVPINHTTKFDKLLYILKDCQARTLITNGRHIEQIKTLKQAVSTLKTVVLTSPLRPLDGDDYLGYDAIQSDYSDLRPPCRTIDRDLACLIYTSGSTGEPKGVMSDHSNVVFAATSITSYLGNVESDIVIGLLPLSFDYGLYQLLMVFSFGGTLVLEQGFTYPAAVLKLIETERVTGLPGVPTIFTVLLKMNLSNYDLSNLRYLTNTAAVLPPSHITEIRNKFPQATLYSMYGLTETKRTLFLPPEQLEKRPGSVGIPIPGTEAWIEDDDGQRLGAGAVGELVVRGRHVMRGYWNAPDKTAVRFRSGFLPGEQLCYTGDLFKLDEEGYFYFVARKDDVIKSRGEKVPPKEVENVLYQLDGVEEVAVVGVPDPILGQAVKAFVVLNSDARLTVADLLRHCRLNLEDFMVPRWIALREDLPKSANGKINKLELV